jgi:hypothetical protein
MVKLALLTMLAGCNNGEVCGIPPAACSSAEGNLHLTTAAEAQRLLPGRWFFCSGDMRNGEEVRLGGPSVIGFEFNADVTLWWYLFDDGHGRAIHHAGTGTSGTVAMLSSGDGPGVLLYLTAENISFALPIELGDGTPLHLGLESFDAIAHYVHEDSSCGKPPQPGYDGGVVDGAFGGDCDTFQLLPDSCPSVGGVVCSVCVQGDNSLSCAQPCSVSGGGCPEGQTCRGAPHRRSGDCAAFDGYCQ